MKRMAMFAMSLGVALFAAGCGKTHGDREAVHDAQQLSHAAASDVNQAAHDVEHAAHDLSHAADATIVNAQTDVRQAAVQVREDVHAHPEVIQVRGDFAPIPVATPLPTSGQLREAAKVDAASAVGDAAQAEAEKLFKVR